MTTQEAKNIRIADYLQSLGYTPVKQQGNSLWYTIIMFIWNYCICSAGQRIYCSDRKKMIQE